MSKSGYYEWYDRPESATAQRWAHLSVLVKAVFDASDETYDHRRVHAQLARQGEACTPEPVRGIMRELGLGVLARSGGVCLFRLNFGDSEPMSIVSMIRRQG